ncbi:mmr1 hsr1 gtp binding protein [Moniliophthora roreri]|uniref:Guanine nucleotide-binding protein-like 1 n=1 Tax=Moniliophthora roreri TaxID=221103 RepID=A0A0W0FAN8_MONRR|nr:mmr1 hsr1 gtp binding protein [Moniliophthora roreri]
MTRRKPMSTRQKKEEIKLKRAIKRGDVDPPPPKPQQHRRKRPGNSQNNDNQAAESSRKLQSSFTKYSATYLKETQLLASRLPLHRPIQYVDTAIYTDQKWTIPVESELAVLTCPRRPKWRFEMSKKDVEANEEGLFKKWLTQTDELCSKWVTMRGDPEVMKSAEESMPPSTTYFERNLEVWRQLWRVTEISQIVLVLLDSRCPLLHFPPSLAGFLSKHQVILVLTKTDICGPVRAAAWTSYLCHHFPQFPVVSVMSYVSKDQSAVHQGRAQYQPHIPETFRERLVAAMKELHAKLLKPPENARSSWRPHVKREIKWEEALAPGDRSGIVVGGALEPKPTEGESQEEPPFLTIGLVGQPNVGKSSLLNALFGSHRVKASRTPGKTKHFQTLFWTSDIRLVDCPGLVMPNYVPMEMQVLCGVLPIARLPAIPACIHFACQLLPLEEIFDLIHPSTLVPPKEDKRTWREGMTPRVPELIQWTAMDVLVAYADKKGWLTAKAGRPDTNRAGNAILRALAENKVPWAFWPPGTLPETIELESTGQKSKGIWLVGKGLWEGDEESSDEEDDTVQDRDDDWDSENLSGEDGSEQDGDDIIPVKSQTISSRFAALQVDDEVSEEESDDDIE